MFSLVAPWYQIQNILTSCLRNAENFQLSKLHLLLMKNHSPRQTTKSKVTTTHLSSFNSTKSDNLGQYKREYIVKICWSYLTHQGTNLYHRTFVPLICSHQRKVFCLLLSIHWCIAPKLYDLNLRQRNFYTSLIIKRWP